MKTQICVMLLAASMLPLCGMRLDVRDFGAKGDGVADDFAAIQWALNKAEEYRNADKMIYANNLGKISSWGVWDGGNPEVFLPKGTYRISRPLVGQKNVTLCGEDGSVIEGADSQMLLLYLHSAFRCTVRNLTFRKGGSHICFWTANQNTATMLFDNCRFEQSSDAAIFTEAWGDISAKGPETWDKQKYCSPYELRWEDGLPKLTRSHWEHRAPNSTIVNIRNCEFVDCAAAYRGSTDGQNFHNIRFRSSLPQTLPIWEVTGEYSFTDMETIANLPKDYPHAWIVSTSGQFSLIRVKTVSTTEYGAPLLSINQPPRKERVWSAVYNTIIEDCTADADNSPLNALVDVKRVLPSHVTVRRCREARSRTIELFHFQEPPKTEADLLESCSAACKLPPVNLTYAICMEGNGAEIKGELPDILKPFVVPQVDQNVSAIFPKLPEMKPLPNMMGLRRFDAADYGISMTKKADDTDNLQRLFDDAAKDVMPLILLPGRRFEITRTLKLPSKAVIYAQGQTFIAAKDQTFDLLAAQGDVNLTFFGIGLSGGRHPLVVEGSGNVLFDNGRIYDTMDGLLLKCLGDKPLRVSVQASTLITPVLAENHGADFTVLSCWFELGAMLNRGAGVRNYKGITQFCNILGVPEIFSEMHDIRPNWPGGHDLFWVENHDVFRSYHTRYGGEWSGLPVVSNFGKGKVFIEGNAAHFVNKESRMCLIYNHDDEATVVVQQLASMHRLFAGETFCRGILPKNLHVCGYLGDGLINTRH